MIAHQLRYLAYLLAGVSGLPAFRLSQGWWDRDYARGGLARTEGDVELPRHLLVAGLARHYAPGGAILDIGCGTGGLTTPLCASFAGSPFRYLGLDFSDVSLQQAIARRDEGSATDACPSAVQFVQADFDEYVPTGSFDVVIFSESLYYAPDPLTTVRRYTSALSPDGIVIVSVKCCARVG